MTTRPLGKRRFALVVVAVGCLGVGLFAASAALNATGQADTANEAAAPDWLREAATRIFASCGDAAPESAGWALVSGSQYAAAVDETTGDEAGDVQLYVVVAHGDFRWYGSRPVETHAAPTGRTLVVTYDPTTHDMATLDLLIEDSAIEAELGATHEL